MSDTNEKMDHLVKSGGACFIIKKICPHCGYYELNTFTTARPCNAICLRCRVEVNIGMEKPEVTNDS